MVAEIDITKVMLFNKINKQRIKIIWILFNLNIEEGKITHASELCMECLHLLVEAFVSSSVGADGVVNTTDGYGSSVGSNIVEAVAEIILQHTVAPTTGSGGRLPKDKAEAIPFLKQYLLYVVKRLWHSQARPQVPSHLYVHIVDCIPVRLVHHCQ